MFIRELARMLVEDGSVRKTNGLWIGAAELEETALPPHRRCRPRGQDRRFGAGYSSNPRDGVGSGSGLLGRSPGRNATRLRWGATRGWARDARAEGPDPTSGVDPPRSARQRLLSRVDSRRHLLRHQQAPPSPASRSVCRLARRRNRGKAGEQRQVTGFHLERAHRYLIQLGTLDTRTDELARRAAADLEEAASSALSRDAAASAADLAERSIALTKDSDPALPARRLKLSRALVTDAQYERASPFSAAPRP